MDFANQSAFYDPESKMLAMGANLNPASAITDSTGKVLAYAKSGGMLAPQRHILDEGETLFRFGGSGRSGEMVAAGSWWLARAEFDKVLSFGETHGLSVGAAMRFLCLVPPEWSNAGTLVRARVRKKLLAWRGLGNTAVTVADDGGVVTMPHQNEIAARRCHQLFIPGLRQEGMVARALSIETCYKLDPADSVKGFLYV